MPVAKPAKLKKGKRVMLEKAVKAMDGSGGGKGNGAGRRNAVAKCRNPKRRKSKK